MGRRPAILVKITFPIVGPILAIIPSPLRLTTMTIPPVFRRTSQFTCNRWTCHSCNQPRGRPMGFNFNSRDSLTQITQFNIRQTLRRPWRGKPYRAFITAPVACIKSPIPLRPMMQYDFIASSRSSSGRESAHLNLILFGRNRKPRPATISINPTILGHGADFNLRTPSAECRIRDRQLI